jgi:hypothetical protein
MFIGNAPVKQLARVRDLPDSSGAGSNEHTPAQSLKAAASGFSAIIDQQRRAGVLTNATAGSSGQQVVSANPESRPKDAVVSEERSRRA